MTKETVYGPEAERLYVYEQCGLAEIASRLNVAERTVRNWKERGDWDAKRKAYMSSRKAFHEELYEFSRELMAGIREDLQAKREVSPGRLYAFTKILPNIFKAKEYEDVSRANDKDAKPGDGAADTVGLIEDILGIKRG
ncbi:MAG: DUF1804 family protein [Desulfovibrionaceae bacterium]|nr:DUF1804 family protein [Desulfovibrionaceae bacterium]MBF0513641.1 DUF1804 family protein [Desulfovibrionaceae bacterium]